MRGRERVGRRAGARARRVLVMLCLGPLLAAAGVACGSPPGTRSTPVAGRSAEVTEPPPVTSPPSASTAAPTATPTAAQPPQLPRGGTTIFPRYRVVAYYGTAGTASMGVLGDGSPAAAAGRLEQAAAPFATPDRTVQPAMELIVTIADRKPGPDGDYSHDIDPALARQYLQVARDHKQLLVLDIQPGRTEFLKKVRAWEPLLREPDVGLALDPEWRMPSGGVPGLVRGYTKAAEINAVADWLAELTRTAGLPQKLFVLHQFTQGMIPDLAAVTGHPELATVQHIDGFGSPADKLSKYQFLQHPEQFRMGFKLFYDEDTPMLAPGQALALNPPPDYFSFQ